MWSDRSDMSLLYYEQSQLNNSVLFHKVFKNPGKSIRIRSVVKDRAGSSGGSSITSYYPDRTDC